MRDTLFNQALAKESLAVATRDTNTTVNGTSVNRIQSNDVFRVATVIVHAGTVTDGTHTIEVQESDDDSTWSAVADADLQGTEPAISASNTGPVFEIGYTGAKQFLRVSVTTASATSGATFGALVQLGQPSSAPVSRS